MLKNGQKNLKSCGVHTPRFLKKVWLFFNVVLERVKGKVTGSIMQNNIGVRADIQIFQHKIREYSDFRVIAL